MLPIILQKYIAAGSGTRLVHPKVLIFIEYTEREKRGTNSSYFFEQQMSPYSNDVKDLIYKNRDIFCNMLLWEDSFEVYVFNSNGK
jgi:hypothetical protein